MSKFIVSGYIGFDNFGDEAIASLLVKKLKQRGAEKITLISSNPKRTSNLYGVESCGMLKFFNSICEADILISGGGSLLQDVTSIKSLLYYLGVIYIALFLGKKIEIFAQGIGPINSKFGRFLTKNALKRCTSISVRDKASQQLLENWGIKSELVKDPIFDIEVPVCANKQGVGVQLRSFKTLESRFLEQLAEEIVKRFPDKKIFILSLQDDIDFEICKNFEKMLKEKSSSISVEVLNNLSLDEVIKRISSLEYLIAMRFHANVIGIKTKVKTLAINYDIKVKKLAEEYDLPLINLDDKDFSKEFDKILA